MAINQYHGIDELMLKFAACIFLFLYATSVTGIETRAPETSRELDDAWKAYLMDAENYIASMQYPHHDCFDRSAAIHDLPATLLMAVARGESDFNARAISKADAIGLMQIRWPNTAKHLGINKRSDLFNPCINIAAGARYLRELLSRYSGNLHRSLAAYNYGPGRISVQGDPMPTGAIWYSGYIYRHLRYVLASATANESNKQSTTQAAQKYKSVKKLKLITFRTPYRARAFVDKLKRQQLQNSYGDRLEWFRTGARTFEVVLLYSSTAELKLARQWLKKAGFSNEKI